MSHHQAYILDRLGYGQSLIHQLDPRAKLIATLLIIGMVVSFPKYALSELIPFISFPIFLALLGFIPFRIIGKAILMASPFFVLVGLFNPILDRKPIWEFLGISFSGGWISFFSIILRGWISVAMATVLIGTTSFPRIVEALQAFKVPKAFTTQLLLLYRYLFVLIEESKRMNDAKALRSFSSQTSFRTYISLLGSLLTRSFDRAETIYLAMRARGFSGEMKSGQGLKLKAPDIIFLLSVGVTSVFFRIFPVSYILGSLVSW